MRLSADVVARIKACEGVYSMGDTARAFAVSKSTVSDIWKGVRHTQVAPAPEPPNVPTSRVPAYIVRDEARVLLQRGGSPEEVAQSIGVSVRTLYNHVGTVTVIV